MSIDLGLEYLQVNKKPNGSLFEAYNEFLTANDELRETINYTLDCCNAFDNLYSLKYAIKKCGKTNSLESLVGKNTIYSCENFISKAWEAIKEFFRKIWTKFMTWIKTSNFYINKLIDKLRHILHDKANYTNLNSECNIPIIDENYAKALNTMKCMGNEQNLTDIKIQAGKPVYFILADAAFLNEMEDMKNAMQEFCNDPDEDTINKMVEMQKNNEAFDVKIDRSSYSNKFGYNETVLVKGAEIGNWAKFFEDDISKARDTVKNASNKLQNLGKFLDEAARKSEKISDDGKSAMQYMAKQITSAAGNIILRIQEMFLANCTVINKFISSALKAKH